MAGQRDVILYELNEVPWEVVDLYVKRQPSSTLAQVLERSQSLTTVNDDSAYLQPWRTWPTFHTGLYAEGPEGHQSMELGQDPDTFRGEPVWETADRAGRKVGLFGVLQSWPARELRNGGFWVPDTFARSVETVPPELSTFQEFNLSMTADNTFSATAPLDAKRMAKVGADLLARGLTPRSVGLLARQIVRERRDDRWKAARPMAQVLPAFDLYWRLQKKHKPNLSLFFTNHVAGMMHRFWGDAMPGYSEQFDYKRDDVFAKFMFEALDLFDAQLKKIVRWVDAQPSAALLIASSMGQAPIYYNDIRESYVLRDTETFSRGLGFPANEPGMAMYPRTTLEFSTDAEAAAAAEKVGRLSLEGEPLFDYIDASGRTLSMAVSGFRGTGDVKVEDEDREISLADLGFVIEERLGGGNTAHHIPQGIWIAYGDGIPADSSRTEFSALEAKPRLLDMLGVPAGQREPEAAAAG